MSNCIRHPAYGGTHDHPTIRPSDQQNNRPQNRPTDDLDQLRHIEGFPIGEDEDLHALSDPPHYTAYPNPHIAEFIEKWTAERARLRAELGLPNDSTDDDGVTIDNPQSAIRNPQSYHREPYVADVSEGKNDPIYNAHSYHTKVPYKAIMRFIEHYTEPGDIVFDGFCGTGMTGVATQMLGRRAILVDLSPAATFIAYNYNTPVDVAEFEHGEYAQILREADSLEGLLATLRSPGFQRQDMWEAQVQALICCKADVYVHSDGLNVKRET